MSIWSDIRAGIQRMANWQVIIPVTSPAFSGINWGEATFDSTYYMGMQRVSSPIQNAEITWKIDLSAGTWTFRLAHKKDTNRGIYTVLMDGVAVGTIDGYAASVGTATFDTITGIVIATSGAHTVTLKMATKNGSSSNYIGTPSVLMFTRTA